VHPRGRLNNPSRALIRYGRLGTSPNCQRLAVPATGAASLEGIFFVGAGQV
jgi:hypothetical protein